MQSKLVLKAAVVVTSILSLVACLAAAVALFLGGLSIDRFKWYFLIASVLWFAAATLWSTRWRAGR